MEKLILTETEVLKLLGISSQTLEMWIKNDGFPKPLKVCNSYGEYGYGRKRYSIEKIKKWLHNKGL